jgi:hypothetical protein
MLTSFATHAIFSPHLRSLPLSPIHNISLSLSTLFA